MIGAAGAAVIQGVAFDDYCHVVDLIDQIVGVLLCGIVVDHLVGPAGDGVGGNLVSVVLTVAVVAVTALGDDGPLSVGTLV